MTWTLKYQILVWLEFLDRTKPEQILRGLLGHSKYRLHIATILILAKHGTHTHSKYEHPLFFSYSGYMSPEYAMNGIFSEKSDIYSFGVLMLEIVSGKKSSVFSSSSIITLIEQVSNQTNLILFQSQLELKSSLLKFD